MRRLARPGRVLLLAFGLALITVQAHARPCGLWTVTMMSDCGGIATLRLSVRKCGSDQPSHIPPSCRGRYRCKGPTCVSRRGRFTAFVGMTPAGAPSLLLNLASPSGRYCLSGPPSSSAEPSNRYTCYTRRDALIDKGVLGSCQTEVARAGCAC